MQWQLLNGFLLPKAAPLAAISSPTADLWSELCIPFFYPHPVLLLQRQINVETIKMKTRSSSSSSSGSCYSQKQQQHKEILRWHIASMPRECSRWQARTSQQQQQPLPCSNCKQGECRHWQQWAQEMQQQQQMRHSPTSLLQHRWSFPSAGCKCSPGFGSKTAAAC